MKTLEELRQQVLANPLAARLLVAGCARIRGTPDVHLQRRVLAAQWMDEYFLTKCLADAAHLSPEAVSAKIAADDAEFALVNAAFVARQDAQRAEKTQLCAPGSILDSVVITAKEAA